LKEDIILGANFFAHQKIRGKIDIGNKFVKLRGKKFPFRTWAWGVWGVRPPAFFERFSDLPQASFRKVPYPDFWSCPRLIQMQNANEKFTTKQTSDEITRITLVPKLLI